MDDEFIESSLTKPDEIYENTLRPQSLKEFVGQDAVRERLEVFIGAAKKGKSL
ncbi:MAG: hypothetical protein LVR00_02525 [Rhabdochlamydiaceae bacterium]|jgi:Holliday junction DNA helicase RuvB